MNIEDKAAVSLAYTLTDAEGNELDKSTSDEPFAYLHGSHGIIPGLESALAGKTVGDAFKVTIEPEDGYGEREDALVSEVSKDLFEGVEQLEVGMAFHGESDQGPQMVVVTAIDGDTVTVDANPPLAGMQLTFEVEVLDVRAATAAELEHGHVHGPGGHHH
jgi:FKBP-type peptidyl-prolyl cis-trans isomerase SlyD